MLVCWDHSGWPETPPHVSFFPSQVHLCHFCAALALQACPRVETLTQRLLGAGAL